MPSSQRPLPRLCGAGTGETTPDSARCAASATADDCFTALRTMASVTGFVTVLLIARVISRPMRRAWRVAVLPNAFHSLAVLLPRRPM